MKTWMRTTIGLAVAMALAVAMTGCGGGGSSLSSLSAGSGSLSVTGQVSRQTQTPSLSGAKLTVDGTQVTGTFDGTGHMTLTGIAAGMHTLSMTGSGTLPNAANIPFEMPQQLGNMLMDMTVDLDANGQLESVACTFAPDADRNGVMDQSGVRHSLTLPDGSYAMHNAGNGQTQMWQGDMRQEFADMNGDFMQDGGGMGMGANGSGGMGGGMR
jgi:hypothetical protein